MLAQVLPDAQSVLAWLLTYLLHSTLWFVGAWIIARWIREPALREKLWKGALLGGMASALLVTLLGGLGTNLGLEPSGGVFGLMTAEGASGSPISIDLGAAAGTVASQASPSVDPSAASAGPFSALGRVSLAQWLVGLWILGAAIGIVRFDRKHVLWRRALRGRRRVEDPELLERLASLRTAAGIARPVRLSMCRELGSPVALLGDEIVIPERALERLSPCELETMLAHELAHLARRDPLALLALGLIQHVLFVQPLHRLAAARSCEAAELCCDDLAARWTRGELALARCLAEVASWVEGAPARGLAVGMVQRASPLVERVERLLQPKEPTNRRLQGALVGTFIATSMVVLACVGPDATRESQASVAKAPTEHRLDVPGDSQSEEGEAQQSVMLDAPQAEAEALSTPPEGLHSNPREQGTLLHATIVDTSPEERAELDLRRSDFDHNRNQLEARIAEFLDRQKLATDEGERVSLSVQIRSDREVLDEMTPMYQARLHDVTSELQVELDLKAARQGRLPAGSSVWIEMQREIDGLQERVDRLRREREALPTAPPAPDLEAEEVQRVLDIIDDCPEANIAFHVPGAASRPTAAREHAIELRANGSIWCGEMQLVRARGHDRRLLQQHLNDIARSMPRAAPPGRVFGDMSLPDERLDILISPRAPHTSLQRVLQACAQREAMIWKMNLISHVDGRRGESISFALPMDVGVGAELLSGPVDVVVRATSARGGMGRRLEYEASYRLASTLDAEGREVRIPSGAAPIEEQTSDQLGLDLPGLRETRKTSSLETLVAFVREVHSREPDRMLTIDARPGVLYAEVKAVMDGAIQAGFTDVTFVGEVQSTARR